jgi:chorismate-pyruvate lyase
MSAARPGRLHHQRVTFDTLPRLLPKTVNTSQTSLTELHELVKLFYNRVDDLARFQHVSGDELPPPYGRLLNHSQHMTVTVESHHGCPVDVRVLEYKTQGDQYLRKILLSRQRDDRVVQFGIVRLHTRYLSDTVRQEIEARSMPLGRVLIKHDVLRRVELGSLWRVDPGVELSRHFQLHSPKVTFGRTAIIHCDDEPAVELLEIVSPDPTP